MYCAVYSSYPVFVFVSVRNRSRWVLIRSLDLTTRSGLKKVHARFDAISERLDRAYEENLAREKVLGGIIGIYAKMCADSILMNKLFAKGLLLYFFHLADRLPTPHRHTVAVDAAPRHADLLSLGVALSNDDDPSWG